MAVVVAVATGCAAVGMVGRSPASRRHRRRRGRAVAAARCSTGPATACSAAAAIARIDGARLTRCGLDGAGAQVEVGLSLPGGLSRFGRAVAQARAGPVAQ